MVIEIHIPTLVDAHYEGDGELPTHVDNMGLRLVKRGGLRLRPGGTRFEYERRENPSLVAAAVAERARRARVREENERRWT
jgi:hypothetical protein